MLKSFTTILLLSGYAHLPCHSMYRKLNEDMHHKVVSSLMLNRFETIMQNLQLTDNINLGQSDKLAKVRTIPNYMNDSCLKKFCQQQTISINQLKTTHFGRHGTKQYTPRKLIKFEHKMWAAATCQSYGI